MDLQDYTIQELSERSGVPRRNIYFYVQQGVLPPPQGAGLGARYNHIHLLRLRAIPVLRSQGLRLDQIREKLDKADLSDLEALLISIPRLLHEVRPVYPPSPNGESFIHYHLPAGMTLVAPANLSAEDRSRLETLLQAARTIFHPGANPPHPIPGNQQSSADSGKENS